MKNTVIDSWLYPEDIIVKIASKLEILPLDINKLDSRRRGRETIPRYFIIVTKDKEYLNSEIKSVSYSGHIPPLFLKTYSLSLSHLS
jgi:hypothetical protein